jgi:hydrogenase maturation factor
MKNYKYLIFDGQYFLVRNYKALIPRYKSEVELKDDQGNLILDKEGKSQYYTTTKMTADDIVQSFFYSIAKFAREVASCRKIILCFDSAPYHKSLYIDGYKGSRHYVTNDDLLEIDKDKNPLDYVKIKEEIKLNKIKREAKKFIIKNFSKLGMYVLIHNGYEADDLAYLTAQYLENDTERSCLVSIDDDWSYLINRNVDLIKSNTLDKFTYEMELTENGILFQELGISLFQYGAYYSSLYGSHNDLVKTIKQDNAKLKDVIKNCLKKDYCNIKKVKKFKAQLKSFDIKSYPEYEQVLEEIKLIETDGSIMSTNEYELFALLNNFKIRTGYYSNCVQSLDSTLYKQN